MTETIPAAGNRLALVGAIWYLLEIPILFPFVSATAPSVARTADFVAYYSAQKTNLLKSWPDSQHHRCSPVVDRPPRCARPRA